MTTHSHSALGAQSSHRFHWGQLLYQVGRITLAGILFILILLLGQSMVHHRFFKGGRYHQNGSLGQ